MLALGGPAAAGIPQTIPPVPSYIESRSPGVNAANVAASPAINVILNPGQTTVNESTIKLLLDGAQVAATVTPGATISIDYTVPILLEPLSVHQVSLVHSDSVAGLKTNTWSFTIENYQYVTLPTPIHFENFDAAEEGSLPAGWVATNATTSLAAGLDLDNANSDSYLDWVVISKDRLLNVHGQRRLNQNSISVNGVLLESLVEGNFVYAESDVRGGSQVQVLFSPDFNLTGKSNVFVAFYSTYEQNQDDIAAVEYSINAGVTWLPILYMLDGPDIIRNSSGGIDAEATLNTARSDQAHGLSYGTWIGAAISPTLAPFISQRVNDDQRESKRVELVRLAQADNQPMVRFRFLQAGTASWYFGIDNFGLYSINRPIISAQPQSITVDAGTTATFSVTASGAPPLAYQWQFNGSPLSGQTSSTLTINNVSSANAGDYKVVVSNADGPTTSLAATLTVITAPQITSQPRSTLVSAGGTASFNVTARGQSPLNYQWQREGAPLSGATSANLAITGVKLTDAGQYKVVVSNSSGSVTSVVAQLTVYDLAITNELVLHLKFDNDANDSSSRGNNGTPTGQDELGNVLPGFVTGGAQRIGTHALQLQAGQHIGLGQPADLMFAGDVNFSFAFWVKGDPGAWTGDPSFIGNKNWASGGNPGYVVAGDGGGIWQWNWKGADAGRRDADGISALANGTWHSVVVTHDRQGLASFYMDGVLRMTVPIAGDGDVDTGLDVNIGNDGTGGYGFVNDRGARWVNTFLDDFGVWRRLLTSQEIASIYAKGLQGKDLTEASGATVVLPPTITAQPASVIASAGSDVSFTVGFVSDPPTTYQWQKDGANISGATSSNLTLTAVGASASGEYKLIITNPGGSSTSQAARLKVSAAPVGQDLVVHLKFDNNYSDSSGRSNNATPKGAPGFAAGKIGQAFRFTTTPDGSKLDYATLGYPEDLKFKDTNDFSLAFWVNYSDQVDDPAFISNKDWDSSSNTGWGVFAQGGGNFRVNVTGTPRGSGNRMSTTLANIIRDGTWHHVAASFWRGRNVAIYVDGQLVNTTPLVTTGTVDTDGLTWTKVIGTVTNTGPFQVNIGQDGRGIYTDNGSAGITNALIDDLGIWKRALTPQEVAAIHKAGQAGNDFSVVVVGGPEITAQPQNQTAIAGLNATFSVTAVGAPPLSYLWKFNGSDLAGQTGASLVITNVSAANAGSYQVFVTNPAGSVPSAVVTLTVNPPPPVVVTGQWDFDQGDLRATVGAPLEYRGNTATATTFSQVNINGQPAKVMSFPAATATQGYVMPHGALPNGGGTYVNRYTLITDVMFPTESDGTWRVFLQTNTGNSNDGDFFVNPANGIGISGAYHGTIVANKWHRVVFSVNLNDRSVGKYIDGVLVNRQTLGAGVDGRWSLDPVALLFSDEDGDTAVGFVNSIQFRNGVMTDAEVAALGGATAAGIPGPQTAELRITSITQSGTTVTINWSGDAGIKLQKSATLINPNWQDVAGSLGSSSATETIGAAPAFYRLAK